jgi:hypothetical protein
MKQLVERTLFSVVRHGAAWAVEHEGGLHAHSPDKEEAKAWAHKRAREVVDRGGAARVVVSGESVLR